MPPGPLKIKEKSYLTNAPPSDMPTNTVKLYQPRLLHCQYNLHAVSRVAMSLQLQHICLLAYSYCHQHRCCSNMPTGRVLLQDGRLLDCGHSISIPADLLSLNIACLLALCFSICYTCWYGVSLSAVPAGMVSHYQPCLLLHYRLCLLVWYLTISHACWCGASL